MYILWNTRACRFPYPPEVFPVGLFGDVVFGVDFSLQGTEASPLRDVFFAEHACYLEHIHIKLLDFTSNVKYSITEQLLTQFTHE